MSTLFKTIILFFCFSIFISCNNDDMSSLEEEDTEIQDDTSDTDDTDDSNTNDTDNAGTLYSEFADFLSEIDIVLIDDNTVSVETDGLPNHTSPY